MIFTVNKPLLLFLSLTFIAVTVIGTVSHEGGHYIAAKIMGIDAHIHYAMTSLSGEQLMSDRQEFWLILAGPLQTMLTGTIGLFFLRKSSKPSTRLSTGQWAWVFLTLFWLRQLANFVVAIGTYLITGTIGENGDEIRLSKYLNWPEWSIAAVTAVIGFTVLVFVLFKVIPKPLRFTFMLSGLIGGISGYLLWIVYFGKFILP